MKKIISAIVFAALTLPANILTSCIKDGDETIALENGTKTEQSNILQKEYFTVDDAVYHNGVFPGGNGGNNIGTVTVNDQALSGGMNYIIIRSTVLYKIIYIGVRGVSGYYAYTPRNISTENGYYVYIIPLYYTPDYDTNMTLTVCGEDDNGNYTDTYTKDITYVSSLSGDLNINLTFTTAKDVDLHLITPSGEHIFYYNRGGTKVVNGTTVSYGLDHDSNAACYIDNLNNENIYIPAELVEAGTYEVIVDLFQNCDRYAGPTQWAVVARYKGSLIRNELEGGNPRTGYYANNASNGDLSKVMRFTITQDQINSRRIKSRNITHTEYFPVNDIARMKYEEAQWK